MFVNEKVAKSCFRFYCEKCDYGTGKKSSMDKHIASSKHLKSIIVNETVAKSCCVSHTCQNCKKTYIFGKMTALTLVQYIDEFIFG